MSLRISQLLCCTSTQNTQHGTQIRFEASNIDVEDIVGDVDDQSLRKELESCKKFLTDTEMENGKHGVFTFAVSSFDISSLNDKLDYVFKKLKCAAKTNLAFGFVLKNNADGKCRYFHAHENNTIMEDLKFVCTPNDIANLKEKLQKMDIVDLCTREREPIPNGGFQTDKSDNFCSATQRRTYGL